MSTINVCFGSALHYLDNKALNDGSGDINISLVSQILLQSLFAFAVFQVAQSTSMEI